MELRSGLECSSIASSASTFPRCNHSRNAARAMPPTTLRTFARSLLERAGVRDRHRTRRRRRAARRRSARPHDARARAARAVSRRDRARDAWRSRASRSVRSRRAAAEIWDGERLPGPWLTLRALDRARGDGARLRHRHRRHSPLAPHRLSRRVPASARPTQGLSRSSKARIPPSRRSCRTAA